MRITLKEQPSFLLYLGRQGENKVKTFEFDFTNYIERFGAGELSLVVKRGTDTEPYPVAIDIEGSIATWIVSNVDTSVVGKGEAQLIYTVDDKIKKTVILKTKVEPSLSPASEEVPEPYDNWIENLAQIGGQIVTNKNIALSEIDSAKTEAVNSISTDKNKALEDIAEDKSDAIQSLQETRDESLQSIANSRINTLHDIDTEGEQILGVMNEKVITASQSADTATENADLAQEYSEQAGIYAQQAQSYAENLHFTDDTEGNITITIGE